ncbi:carbohydrate-binding protein [Thomasclavelia spiroformis]|uniref:carbohydrate-binding protein n=1 Tax=Thomasclavelia spiroformis TaxID=29348 RepID=UPI0029433443|nr:carbohydrate-binding protein [Thomasclavelia spiroformis]
MYSVIKNVLTKGDFELVDMLNKINKLWVENSLTEEERDELSDLARQNAIPDNSYAENTEQINLIWKEIEIVKSRLNTLENDSGTVEPPTEEEYPEYKQPTGKHDAYNKGDKITYNGKKYECIKNNVVWNPDDYPQGWKLIEEE